MGSTDQSQNLGEGLTEEELILLGKIAQCLKEAFDEVRQDINQAFDGIHSELDGLRRDMQEGHHRLMQSLDYAASPQQQEFRRAAAIYQEGKKRNARRLPEDLDRYTARPIHRR